MFDAVVITGADAEPAARTFATLVEGVVDGVVRRATLLSSHDTAELRTLADAAGCRMALGVAAGAFGDTLKDSLETSHVITLGAGALLPAGWPDKLRHELQRRGAPPPDAGLAFRPERLAGRLGVVARLAWRGRLPLTHGALVPRSVLVAHDFDGLAVPTGARWAMAQLTVQRTGGW
jgi:hypothetical protein